MLAVVTLTKTELVVALSGLYSVLHRSLHFWVEDLAEKRGLLGLYKVINDPKGLRTFGVLHLKLKQLPTRFSVFRAT